MELRNRLIADRRSKDTASTGQSSETDKQVTDRTAGTANGDRASKDLTRKGKKEVIEENRSRNDGDTVCERCEVETTQATQSQKAFLHQKKRHASIISFLSRKAVTAVRQTDRSCVTVATIRNRIVIPSRRYLYSHRQRKMMNVKG